MDASGQSYLLSLTESAREILADALVGVYPHGSLMLGGWRPDRSDIDVLVVVDRSLTSTQKSAVGGGVVRGGPAVPWPSAWSSAW